MMTLKQKRIITALAIVNVAIILILVAITTRPTRTLSHSQTSTRPLSSPSTLFSGDCQWRATQLLAQAGLGGTVTLTADGSLDLKISYPLASSQMADDAAQAVWAAFDVAMALQKSGNRCATFTQVQVTILAHSDHTDIQINASTSTADLVAFGNGDLSEDEFIGRVTYVHNTMPNE